MVFLSSVLRSSNKRYKAVTHVLFDIDGLLLQTEDIYTRINSLIVAEYGKQFGWDVRVKVLGTSEMESAEIITRECSLPIDALQYAMRVRSIQRHLLSDAKLFPGAERLINHLSGCDIPMALATSSGKESVAAKTSGHSQLFSLFSHVVAASSDEQVHRGKPAPDVFVVCAQRFPDNPHPSKCLVFEDAPNGVDAALEAGMQVVMVPDSRIGSHPKATLVLNSLLDFQPHLFGLPPFK